MSTSVSTYTSDSESVAFVSNLFLRRYILPLEYANSAIFLLLEAISQLDDLSKKDYSVNLF